MPYKPGDHKKPSPTTLPLVIPEGSPQYYDKLLVEQAAKEKERHPVPHDLQYIVPPCDRRLPNAPLHGRKTRTTITLDRDVFLAIAARALELRLSVSSCINYALAQWIGKATATLDKRPDPPQSADPA